MVAVDCDVLISENAMLTQQVRSLQRQLRIAREALALLQDVDALVGKWAPDVARQTLTAMDAETFAATGVPSLPHPGYFA